MKNRIYLILGILIQLSLHLKSQNDITLSFSEDGKLISQLPGKINNHSNMTVIAKVTPDTNLVKKVFASYKKAYDTLIKINDYKGFIFSKAQSDILKKEILLQLANIEKTYSS